MFTSLSAKLFSFAFLSLIGGSIVINKVAFGAAPRHISPAASDAQSIVLLSANHELSDGPANCNAYPNRQCLTP